MAPPLKYPIHLTTDEQSQLNALTSKGKVSGRTMKRAQILLLSHQRHTIQHIVDVLNVAPMTVNNIRQKIRSGWPRNGTL